MSKLLRTPLGWRCRGGGYREGAREGRAGWGRELKKEKQGERKPPEKEQVKEK